MLSVLSEISRTIHASVSVFAFLTNSWDREIILYICFYFYGITGPLIVYHYCQFSINLLLCFKPQSCCMAAFFVRFGLQI